MFYYDQVPWHGLGVQLDHVATAEEAIAASGLDWKVGLLPLMTEMDLEAEGTTGKKTISIPDKYAVVRMDRGEPLGVVGSVYHPLQNREAFNFFDSVVGSGQAIYHTAGSLKGGRIIWILAKLPETTVVKNADLIDQYILLSNSHDGSSGIKMAITPIRVVCMNTLNVALRSATKHTSLRHCQSNIDKITDVQEALGLVNEYYSEFGEMAEYLASKQLKINDFEAFLDAIGLQPIDGEMSTQTRNVRDKISGIFEGATGTETIKQTRWTAWSAFNSVVEYVDHERTTRATGNMTQEESRLISQWFGSGAQMKQRALDQALILAG